MEEANGIHAHKFFKLGKAHAQKDSRNLKLASLFTQTPTLPDAYDFDLTHSGIPTPMFANDIHGDCVIAGRAHQTLRFEDIEQGSVLMISDKDVLDEYFRETGGKNKDTGLVVLNSLKLWRSTGWKVGSNTYYIQAFAEVNFQDHNEVRQAIYADVGIGLGLSLPNSAKKQIQTGQSWDVTQGSDNEPGSWGGHYVYVSGYTPTGPVCITWGRKQQMTWAWFDKYCDEAYAIFDAKDSFKKSMIDNSKIAVFIASLDKNYGTFSGNPKAEWLVNKSGADRDMKLIEDFWYVDPNGKKWTAPKDSIINGASIPRPLWATVGSPYTDDYRRASIVHDVACDNKTVDRKDADVMFYYACLAGGCSTSQAKLLYAGVRVGAWVSDDFSANILDLEKLNDAVSIEDIDNIISEHI